MVVCKGMRNSRVKAVTFNWLHNMLYLPYLTMILILVIRNNSPNNSLDSHDERVYKEITFKTSFNTVEFFDGD